MDAQQIKSPELMKFWQEKQAKILAIAQKNTEEIVQREMALTDFELLLSVNMPENEQTKLTNTSKKLRNDAWQELSNKFKGNFQKMNEFLNTI